jgi:hypothetical protein
LEPTLWRCPNTKSVAVWLKLLKALSVSYTGTYTRGHPHTGFLEMAQVLRTYFLVTQRDPEVVFWPSVFLEAWGGAKAKKPHIFQKPFFFAMPPSAARPNNHSFLENVCFFGQGTPGLKKTTWPKNTSVSL